MVKPPLPIVPIRVKVAADVQLLASRLLTPTNWKWLIGLFRPNAGLMSFESLTLVTAAGGTSYGDGPANKTVPLQQHNRMPSQQACLSTCAQICNYLASRKVLKIGTFSQDNRMQMMQLNHGIFDEANSTGITTFLLLSTTTELVVLNLIPQHDPHAESQLAVINHLLLVASKRNQRR
jgi:hypothetical protein